MKNHKVFICKEGPYFITTNSYKKIKKVNVADDISFELKSIDVTFLVIGLVNIITSIIRFLFANLIFDRVKIEIMIKERGRLWQCMR